MNLADQLADIYLGQQLLAGSSGTSNQSKLESDTALHPGKDLAVSLPHFGGIIPLTRDPFPFGLGVTARTSIVAYDGRYPLPS